MAASLASSGINLNLPGYSGLSDQQSAGEINSLIQAIQILQKQYQQDMRVVAPAYEAMTAGKAVALYNDVGTLKVRYANATDNTRPCVGFIEKSVATGVSVEVLFNGLNNYQAGLTQGSIYYLDVTNGSITTTRPTGTPKIVQAVGIALSATQIYWNPDFTFLQL